MFWLFPVLLVRMGQGSSQPGVLSALVKYLLSLALFLLIFPLDSCVCTKEKEPLLI